MNGQGNESVIVGYEQVTQKTKMMMRKRNGTGTWSPSPSPRTKCRLKKRAILNVMAKHRGGCSSTTPTYAAAIDDDDNNIGSVSARKLAATLWEINPPQSPPPIRTIPVLESQHQHQHHHQHHHHHSLSHPQVLKDVLDGLGASKDLLKLLRQVWDQRSLTSSLLSALRSELNRAFLQLHRFLHHHDSKRIHDQIRSAMADDLKAQKRLRHRAEWLNKRLGAELADAKASLEREKRAKEILEQVCDELARGIGEDKARVEELKRESDKVREEVEEERQMLQLADVLREERVQMKLSEARYQFEEKNAAVELLRCELEAYLSSSQLTPKFERVKELEAYLKEINFGAIAIQDDTINTNNNDDEDDNNNSLSSSSSSGDGDLHSIELNMDNNNKSYRWRSYSNSACGETSSSMIQWGNICLNKPSSDHDDEIKRYISLDNNNSSASVSELPFPSPTKHWV